MPETLVTPLDKLDKLEPFEDTPVIATAIEIPGAGGGLRDALTVDPKELRKGTDVFVVIHGTVGKVRFDPVKDANAWKRVHILDVVTATLTDRQAVDDMLEEHRKRVDEARGTPQIDFPPTDEELSNQHAEGEHADEPVDGCPECNV